MGPEASEPLVSDLLRAQAADELAKYPYGLPGFVEGVGLGSIDTTLLIGKTRSVDPGLRWSSFPSSDRPANVEARPGGDLDLETSRSNGGHCLCSCVLEEGDDCSATISDEDRRGVFALSPCWVIGCSEATRIRRLQLTTAKKFAASTWVQYL